MNIDQLLNDFFKTDSIDKLTEDTYIILECPVMVVDDSFHVVSWHMPAGFYDKPFQGSIARGELTYEASSVLANTTLLTQNGERFVELEDSPWQRCFSPLMFADIRIGFLILVDINNELRSVDRTILSTIKAVLSKQLFFLTNRGKKMFNTGEEVLMYLLEGKFDTEAMFRLQAAGTWLAEFKPKRFALINLTLYNNLHLGEDELKTELNSMFSGSHMFLFNGEIMLFINNSFDMDIFQQVSEQFRLRVVVSGELENLYNLPQKYASVSQVMEYILLNTSHPIAVCAEQFGTLMMLRRLQKFPDWISEDINALAKYDAANGGQFCLTLYYYLTCHHSLQETCEKLFTHRNTVLYRIRRMKEELGIPTDDPDQHMRLLLSVSLVLLQQHRDDLFLNDIT